MVRCGSRRNSRRAECPAGTTGWRGSCARRVWSGCHRRRPVHVRTTRRDPAATPAPDLVERSFTRVWSRPALGGGYDVSANRAGGLSLFGGHSGRVQSQSGGLVDAGPSADRTGAGRLRDGGEQAAAGGRADPPFRSRLAIYLGALSASGVRRPAFARRWGPWGIASTTPSWRASSRPWSANSWHSTGSAPTMRREQRSLSGWKCSIIGNGGIRHSAIWHQPSTNKPSPQPTSGAA